MWGGKGYTKKIGTAETPMHNAFYFSSKHLWESSKSQMICGDFEMKGRTSKQSLNPKLTLKQAKIELTELQGVGSIELKLFS